MSVSWDTEIDTPATIAIIGAGPIGIEAALYARFLGYYALIFDAGKVADSVLKWGHVPMFTPFGMNSTSLGLAALEVHDQLTEMPDGDQHITGRDFAEKYLIPIARTDLVYDSVHVHSRIHSISRTQSRRSQQIAPQDRADEEFRLVIHSKQRGWYTERADIVLDCSGTYHYPRQLGPGGGLAIGEIEHDEHIERNLPNMLGATREKYGGKHTVLVGSGLSAASTAVEFARIIGDVPDTRLTWVLSHRAGTTSSSPQLTLHIDQVDRFPLLASIMSVAQDLLNGSTRGIAALGAWGVERTTLEDNGSWHIRLLTGEEETLDLSCDRLIAAVGHRPDWRFADYLHINRSLYTDAPIGASAPVQIDQPQSEQFALESTANDFLTTEPHYYVLGSKSLGTDSRFILQHGHQQIRQAFALIGGRADLDLYHSVRPSI